MKEPTELQKRIATGVIGAMVLAGLVLYGGWIGICFISTVLSLAMVNEFAHIVFEQQDAQEKDTRFFASPGSWAWEIFFSPRISSS